MVTEMALSDSERVRKFNLFAVFFLAIGLIVTLVFFTAIEWRTSRTQSQIRQAQIRLTRLVSDECLVRNLSRQQINRNTSAIELALVAVIHDTEVSEKLKLSLADIISSLKVLPLYDCTKYTERLTGG
jgi:hypothetical protein